MTTLRISALAVTLLVALTAPAAAEPPSSGLEGLAWIAGCWAGDVEGQHFSEQWMKPEGGTMIGMSRTIKGERTSAHEFLLIREDETGVHYVARPSGQSEASFRLIKSAGQEAVFENLEHDFPQRVHYRLEADGSLLAAIEGKLGGETKRVEFSMQRVACD